MGALPFVLRLGVRVVCSLENASPFGAVRTLSLPLRLSFDVNFWFRSGVWIVRMGWIVACWGPIGSGMEPRRAAEKWWCPFSATPQLLPAVLSSYIHWQLEQFVDDLFAFRRVSPSPELVVSDSSFLLWLILRWFQLSLHVWMNAWLPTTTLWDHNSFHIHLFLGDFSLGSLCTYSE
jgi:hypothetical protein